MIKLQEEQILENEDIRKVQFENKWWFSVEDIAKLLEEDLKNVEAIQLPIGKNRQLVYCATIEQINSERKSEQLSEFNKKLLKAKNYKPKKK